MVFYDKDGFALTKSQFASICKAMQVVDENTFLFSITEGSDPSYKMILENCGFPIGDDLYKEYLGLKNYALENALFSTNLFLLMVVSVTEDVAITIKRSLALSVLNTQSILRS
ncbi:MAG: hypothetical protein G3M70_11525 [Candidatus Nitronauta litoralis]|uniref:Uncharacterized protein n=1 Tax=Candidatus Nitronauta litoralis TaxID=2705533 RepID=A0A7T0BXU1_9BACT|nr:MAG: hypothetical protein G3M70_11525 [Candidatus Nitronauta litoralis]